jgi:1-acyl-sn-glycerol-3-phosphate acyltransferase
MRGKGKLKSIAVMAYCHFSVSLLCLNVLFDLTMFGFPLYLLHIMRILPYALFLRLTTLLIEWTTPIVFAMPLVFSGTKVFCNDLDLLVEAKASDSSLLLANHGSRIDWMVGMFVGFTTTLGVKACKRVRVGFVCEALIQFMPIIGWVSVLLSYCISYHEQHFLTLFEVSKACCSGHLCMEKLQARRGNNTR